MSAIRTVIVDDHPPIRALFRLLVAVKGDVEVVGEAGIGAEALPLLRELHPDVLVLDAVLPDLDGAAVVRAVRAEAPDVRILVYTGYTNARLAATLLRLGVDGFLLKAATFQDLTFALHQVYRGETYVDPRVAGMRLARPAGPRRSALSPRELEVLDLVAQGCRDQAIADRLAISLDTVHFHVRRLLSKLDATNRTELAIRALDPAGRSSLDGKA